MFWIYRVEWEISDTLIGDLLLHLNTTLKLFQYENYSFKEVGSKFISMLASPFFVYIDGMEGIIL